MRKFKVNISNNSDVMKKISKQVDLALNRYPSAKYIINNNSVKINNELLLISKSTILDALCSVEMEISKAMMTGNIDGVYSIPAN